MDTPPKSAAPPGEHAGLGPRLGTHIPALDSLRGIAVLLVFAFHVKLEVSVVNRLLEEWDSPLQLVFRGLTGPTWVGVELFFVLSGFLITGILFDAKEKKHRFRNFFGRRILRILPVYYVAILVTLFVHPYVLPFNHESTELVQRHQIWYWAHLVNVAFVLPNIHVPHVTGHFWSLAVEEHFYLLWPPVIWTLSRKKAIAVCAGLIVICPLARLALVLVDGGPFLSQSLSVLARANYLLTPLRLDAIAFGGLIALLVRGPIGFQGLVRPARRGFLAAAGILLCIMALTRGHFGMNVPVIQFFGYTSLGVLFASLLVLAMTSSPGTILGRIGENRVLHFFGKYSYAIYIFQTVPLIYFRHILFGTSGTAQLLGSHVLGLAVFTALSLAATVGIALASWHLYEKHCIRLKRFFQT